MMKIALIIILCVHGCIHLIGFVQGFKLANIQELTLPISRNGGLLWLLSSVLLLFSAALVITGFTIWWKFALFGIILSQLLIFYSWQDAKFGSIANLFVGLAILIYIFSTD